MWHKTQEARSLTPVEYRNLVSACNPPTPEQIDEFIEFVREDHSWYKHLPMVPPGTEFLFYIDPHAGMEIEIAQDGSRRYKNRTEKDKTFSIVGVTTADYRKRFGWLSYAANAGTAMYIRSQGRITTTDSRLPIIADAQGRPVSIPKAVAEAGSAWLTAFIHRRTYYHMWLSRRLKELREADASTLEEYGGIQLYHDLENLCAEKYERFDAACEKWEAANREGLISNFMEGSLDREDRVPLQELQGEERLDRVWQVDPDIKELLMPIIERMKGNMRGAINRMIQATFEL